jgi:hypothetical protein
MKRKADDTSEDPTLKEARLHKLEHVPHDTLPIIFSFLDAKELLSVRMTNTDWNKIITTGIDETWQTLYMTEFLNSPKVYSHEQKTYFENYIVKNSFKHLKVLLLDTKYDSENKHLIVEPMKTQIIEGCENDMNGEGDFDSWFDVDSEDMNFTDGCLYHTQLLNPYTNDLYNVISYDMGGNLYGFLQLNSDTYKYLVISDGCFYGDDRELETRLRDMEIVH